MYTPSFSCLVSPPWSLCLTLQPGLALMPDPSPPDPHPFQPPEPLRLLLTSVSTSHRPIHNLELLTPFYRARQSRPPCQLGPRPLRGDSGTRSPRSRVVEASTQCHTSSQLNWIVYLKRESCRLFGNKWSLLTILVKRVPHSASAFILKC